MENEYVNYDYIIIDDIYLNKPIELVIGNDIEKYDRRKDEITLTYEQLAEIIIEAVRNERTGRRRYEKET